MEARTTWWGRQSTLRRCLCYVGVAVPEGSVRCRSARMDTFCSMQDHLNLIYREEEREMLPLCREEKIGVIPYSPLASGRLTRDWSAEQTLRSETDQIAKSKYDATAETDQQVVMRVAEISEKYGVPRVHVALDWLLQKAPVTAPIIGATKISHLEDAVGALDLKLTPEDVAYLEEPYVPHPVVGHE